MTIADSIKDFFRQVFKVVAIVADPKQGRKEFMARVRENLSRFKHILQTDWSTVAIEERERAIADVKEDVVNKLIPLAATISIAGAPGILVYTPCQVVGGLAIAHIRQSNFDPKNPKNYIVILGLLFWGKIGQITWIALARVIGDMLPAPILGLAVVPFVQNWTRMALDRVDEHYRASSNTAVSDAELAERPMLEPDEARDFVVTAQAYELSKQIRRGGKVLFEAQEEIVQELFNRQGSNSVFELGRAHIFRGVAGSGKTIILAQLVPQLVEIFQEEHGREPKILVYHFNNYIHTLLGNEIYNSFKAARPAVTDHKKLFDRIIKVHTLRTLRESLEGSGVLGPPPIRSSISHDGSDVDQRPVNAVAARAIHERLKNRDGLFDIVLIDEGQDVDEEEYKLLIDLCRTDGSAASRSLYVFFDDLQNIFGWQKKVKERLGDLEITEHFLTRCVRTSKKIMDFTMNSCISPLLDDESRTELSRAIGMAALKQKKLVTVTGTGDSSWIDCDFCVFPGEVLPDVRHFNNNSGCTEAVIDELNRLQDDPDIKKFGGSVLVLCFSNNTVRMVYDALATNFGPDMVRRRSGADIGSREKSENLAVESGIVNVATIGDAKGYDADIVFVINPDGTGATVESEKRTRFYVAATRAKQFLAVYSSIPQSKAPIMRDARRALQRMQQV